MKKPLAALILAAAAVTALAVPASASSTTTWTHQTLRCQGGRHATVTYKMQAGAAVDAWATNSCRHQWLTVSSCEPDWFDSPKCFATDIAPKTKAHPVTLGYRLGAVLGSVPHCTDGDTTCDY